jgi:hypothetical protein
VNFRSWMFLPLVALIASVGLATPAAAADTKPVAVVSFSGYEALMSDLDFMGTLSGSPQLRQMVEGIAAYFTKAQGLAGLDQSKPIGAAIWLDETRNPRGYAFVPVTDSEQLLDALSLFIPETEEVGDGFRQLKIKGYDVPVIMIEKNGWAFIGLSKGHLTDLPADPSKLLGDLPSRYDLALRINAGNLPEPLLDQGTDEFRDLAAKVIRIRMDKEADEQYAQRKKAMEDLVERRIKQLRQFDVLTVGWSIDSTTRKAYLDMAVTMKAGSETAKQINAVAGKAKPTRFGALADDAHPAGLYVRSPITQDDRETMLDFLPVFQEYYEDDIARNNEYDESDRKLLIEVTRETIEVAKATIEGGEIDGAAAILGKGPLAAVGALHVADGKRLEATFKKAAKVLGKTKYFPTIQMDVEEHQGVNFHILEVEIDEDGAVSDVFGDPKVALGFGKNSIFVGFGAEPIKSVSGVLEEKAESEGPFSKGVFHVAQWLAYEIGREDNDRQKQTLQTALDILKDGDKDRILITSTFIENGRMSRLEIEEGILKTFGKMAMQIIASAGR